MPTSRCHHEWSAVIVTNFAKAVRAIEQTLIPLKDGTKLAARIWLPEDAEQNPVPAILEYLQYRKRDGTYERAALTHPYLAGHGYAGVRVDLRGSGESTGLTCLPPDPALVGDSWRGMWLERLQNIPLFQENWLQHQTRDAYWKHGSVCEDYAAIKCPVYAVGGWTDG